MINFADSACSARSSPSSSLILALHAAINIYSSHLVALFNNVSVFVHVVGVAIIIAILILVPDRHQSFSFVFTDTINNSGFGDGMFWCYVLPLGFLLTMYTVTGFDASAHVAEETHERRAGGGAGHLAAPSSTRPSSAGSCCWRSRSRRATSPRSTRAAAARSPSSTSAMQRGRAEIVILISTIGQFFCGMACVTSCSRTFYAFSRDRAVPGWRFWTRLNHNRVPVEAVLFVCLSRC